MRSKVITILISKTPSNHTLAQDLLLVATPYVKSPVNNLEGTRKVWTFWSLVKVGRIHIHRPRHITIYCLHLMFSWTCFCVYFIYYLFENRVFFHTIFLTTVTPPPTPSRSSPSPLHHRFPSFSFQIREVSQEITTKRNIAISKIQNETIPAPTKQNNTAKIPKLRRQPNRRKGTQE